MQTTQSRFLLGDQQMHEYSGASSRADNHDGLDVREIVHVSKSMGFLSFRPIFGAVIITSRTIHKHGAH